MAALWSDKDVFTEEFINNALEKSLPLFGFFKYPPGTLNGKPNPNIMAIAESLNAHPTVRTACDYLNLAREPLKHPVYNVNFTNECHEVNINGERFATQTFTMKLPGTPMVKQTHYGKMAKNNHIIVFALTYFNRGSRRRLDRVMNSLKFSK